QLDKKPPRFQSTHSCRVRSQGQSWSFQAKDFNPRTHVECDYKDLQRVRKERNFNPRTHVECDANIQERGNQLERFQSTHSCRVRYKTLKEIVRLREISIHALM